MAPPAPGMSALAPIEPIDPLVNLAAPANEVSTDEQYLRHQFVTYSGWDHWTNGWTPTEMREAITMHLRGWLYQSAAAARDVVRYPAIYGALKQRTAPTERTKWKQGGPKRAPGRYTVQDLAKVWREQFRPGLREKIKDVAMLGGHVGHIHWVYDSETGREMPRLKRWPHEAIVWRPESPAFPGGFYAVTLDSGLVRIVPGDGKWFVLGNGERWHEMGAIVALGLSYVGGELARRDRAGLSEAAGRAAPVGTLKAGVQLTDKQADDLAKVIAGLGRARRGAVMPDGATITPFQVATDTSFFKDLQADELMLIALTLLGQAGTLVPGAGGVYTAPVFQGVAVSLVDSDHECIDRGWCGGVVRPFCEINAVDYLDEDGNELYPLIAERYADKDAKAEAEAKRGQAFAATVKAYKDAGLDLAPEDLAAMAESMGARPGVAKAPPAPAQPPQGAPSPQAYPAG